MGQLVKVLIAVCSMDPQTGGPPRVVAGHARELKRRGHEPVVITTTDAERESTTRDHWSLADDGIETHYFRRQSPAVIGRSQEWDDFVNEKIADFDILHIHGLWKRCLATAATAARRNRVPYVFAPHGMLDAWSRNRSRWKKSAAKQFLGIRDLMHHADGVQVGSEEEADEVANAGVGAETFIIPNGVHLDKFHRTPSKNGVVFEKFPHLSDCDPILLFFNRLHPKKGVLLFLEATAEAINVHPKLGVLVAALAHDKKHEKEVRERALKDDLKTNVAVTTELVGNQSIEAINAADGFVLPSYQEGFSMAVLESMAYRLPMVITDTCHMGFVETESAGYVVPATKAGVLEGILKLVALTDDERAEMGCRGFNWVSRNGTWESIGEQLDKMYESVVRQLAS